MGWKSKFLSQGGKEVLLKAVAMALPTYTMSCFRLPKTTCKQIASLMADFWWRSKSESKGVHWKTWSHLSKAKEEGGLGFRDLEAFNSALLGKQLWRMLVKEDTLLAKVFKSRYFPKSNILNAQLGSRPSFAWKSIHSTQQLIKQGARKEVGNGASIDIWRDPWLGCKPAHPLRVVKKLPPQFQHHLSQIKVVGDLLKDEGREWDNNLLNALLPDEVNQEVKSIRSGGFNTLDSFSWDYSKSGYYSVKSAYWLQTSILQSSSTVEGGVVNQATLNPLFHQLWRVDVAPKVKHFLWRVLSNSLPVSGILARRHMAKEACCLRCPNMEESINHVLFTCTFARLVWAISTIPNPPEGAWADSHYTNLYRILNLGKENEDMKEKELLSPWILWRIWKCRNALMFRGEDWDAQILIQKAFDDAEEWRLRKQGFQAEETPVTYTDRNVKWRNPPVGRLKCNTDGAWLRKGERCGLGWVLRDHAGRAVWLGAKAIPQLKSNVEVEAEALRWALVSLSRLGYTNVIFESDSKGLVETILGRSKEQRVTPVIQDIVFLLRRMQGASVVFSCRETNNVADKMAKKALSLVHLDPILFSVVPSWVHHLVVHEYCSQN